MPLYSQMAWRIFLNLLTRGSFIILTFFIARVLGVEEFGKFGYVTSVVLIFYSLTELGTSLLMTKELGESRQESDRLWKPYLELKLVLIGFCFILFLILMQFIWKWENSWLLIIALFWMFGNSILDFSQAVCNGMGRMDIAKRQIIIQRSLLLSGTTLSLIFAPTLEMILVAMAFGSVTGSLLGTYLFFRKFKIRLSFSFQYKEWKRILVASLPLALGGFFGTCYLRLGTVVLGWIWGGRILGEYSAAFKIFETTYIIPAAVMSIGMPYLAEYSKKESSAYRHEFVRVFVIMAVGGFLWGGIIFLYSPSIIKIVFGSLYLNTVPVLRVFGLASVVVFLNYFITYIMIIINCQKRHAWHMGISFLVGVVLYITIIPYGKSLGAAYAFLFIELILFMLTTSYLFYKRRLAFPDRVY